MSTIKDVAKASGVSAATVSYVLNNRPGTVSAPTRERVLTAMRELNYRPSPLFRRKHASRTNTLGILQLHWGYNTLIRYPYFAYVLDGILMTATTMGWHLTMFTNTDWSDVPRSLRTYLDGRCDGLMMISPPKDFPLISGLRERGFPFVVINGGMADTGMSTVDVDNVAGGRTATEHLLGLGHRRIAMLPGGIEYADSLERVTGYRDAFEAAGVDVNDDFILPGTYSEKSGTERARTLLSLPKDKRPTAFFCGNDQIAQGVVAAASESGLAIPGDLSIVGFDESAPNTAGIRLTTIRQPLVAMASRAAELLIQRIGEEDSANIVREIFPFELVIKDSTGPCPFD